MRKFYLENEAGERVSLCNENGIFLQNPSGMGITMGTEYTDLKHGFFAIACDDTDPQSTLAGDLVFHSTDPYGAYKRLADWLAKAQALYLIYAPGNVEYRRKVSLYYLTKTELGGRRWMTCPVAFQGLTPWFTASAAVLHLEELEDNVLRCDYDGSVQDEAILADRAIPGASGILQPGGHIEAAFRLRYTGALTDPVITLVGQNTGTEYGRVVLDLSTAEGETLIVSSEYDGSGIWIQRNGVLVDAIDAVDLAYDPYPRAPVTEPCTMTLSAANAITGAAIVTVFYFFRGV